MVILRVALFLSDKPGLMARSEKSDFYPQRWTMKAGQTVEVAEPETARFKKVRVPKVVSYAYQLINIIHPLVGVPLNFSSAPWGVGQDKHNFRYQRNSATLDFPGMRFFALVRSWENVDDAKGPKRKTLESLTIDARFRTEAEMNDWERRLTKLLITHCTAKYDIIEGDECPYKVHLEIPEELAEILKLEIIVP